MLYMWFILISLFQYCPNGIASNVTTILGLAGVKSTPNCSLVLIGTIVQKWSWSTFSYWHVGWRQQTVICANVTLSSRYNPKEHNIILRNMTQCILFPVEMFLIFITKTNLNKVNPMHSSIITSLAKDQISISKTIFYIFFKDQRVRSNY